VDGAPGGRDASPPSRDAPFGGGVTASLWRGPTEIPISSGILRRTADLSSRVRCGLGVKRGKRTGFLTASSKGVLTRRLRGRSVLSPFQTMCYKPNAYAVRGIVPKGRDSRGWPLDTFHPTPGPVSLGSSRSRRRILGALSRKVSTWGYAAWDDPYGFAEPGCSSCRPR
jgi:hypothetical protein